MSRRDPACEVFERWLDAGMPPDGAAETRAHAVVCTDCSARESAARELEFLLAEAAPAAPQGLTAAVMARIAARPQPAPLAASPLPWWVRAAADPACVLACAAGALFLWSLGRLQELVGAVGAGEQALVGWLGARTPLVLDSRAWAVLAVSMVPTLVLASTALYRWSARQVQDAALARVAR